MTPHILLIILLFILSFDFVLGKVLDILNLSRLRETLPPEVSDIYDEDKYKKSIQYTRVTTRFSFLVSTFGFLLSFVLILTGFFGWYDGELRQLIASENLLALIFFGTLFFASDILNLPFQLYSTFVIEERFGFNKTTPRTFFLDKVKGYLLGILIGGAVLYVFLLLVSMFGGEFLVVFLDCHSLVYPVYEHVLHQPHSSAFQQTQPS